LTNQERKSGINIADLVMIEQTKQSTITTITGIRWDHNKDLQVKTTQVRVDDTQTESEWETINIADSAN